MEVHLNDRDAISRDSAINLDLFTINVYYYSYIML
jgi:hypothetical protein